MNRLFVTIGIIVLATFAGVFSLLSMNKDIVTPPQIGDVAAIEDLNNTIEPAAGGGGLSNNEAPAVKAPTAATPAATSTLPKASDEVKIPTEAKSSLATPAAAKAESAKPVVELTQEEMNQIHTEVKQSIENDFKDKLSFPITEEKMIAFAQASLRVKKINNKWDVQIAGAETDAMAIEYSNFAVEEITKALQSMQNLTLDQYNEMSKLTATSPDFNQAYQVYKQLIAENIIQVPPTPVAPNVPATSASPIPGVVIPATPQAPAAATMPALPPAATKPAVVPAGSGTVPVTQGSPKTPYSPPVSR